MEQFEHGSIGFITSKITKAIQKGGLNLLKIDSGDTALMKTVTCLNAENSMEDILEQSDYIRQRVVKKEVGILSAYYDTTSGEVTFNNLHSIA
jgi:carbonic anhydrase